MYNSSKFYFIQETFYNFVVEKSRICLNMRTVSSCTFDWGNFTCSCSFRCCNQQNKNAPSCIHCLATSGSQKVLFSFFFEPWYFLLFILLSCKSFFNLICGSNMCACYWVVGMGGSSIGFAVLSFSLVIPFIFSSTTIFSPESVN